MSGRGEEQPRADVDDRETDERDDALVERLRTLEWPTPEPGHAERAFERFKARMKRTGDKRS